MIVMIFAVGSVSAVENGTADASDLTLVPHEQVVSVHDSTVQEVETIDTDTSADDTNVEKISSSSDEIINVTDSNIKESLKMSKKGGPVLGASNNEDVLGADPSIIPTGTTFQDIRDAIKIAGNGSVIDLNGKTYNGTNPEIITRDKSITIKNGILDASSAVNTLTSVYMNVAFENVSFINFPTSFRFNYCTFNNVKFNNITSTGGVFIIRGSKLSNVDFTNCKCLMQEDPDNYETGVIIVTYNSEYDNCDFINGSSKRHSGAICVGGENGNIVNITNCNFINCSAGIGGAVYVHGNDATNSNYHSNIINCTFINNTASEYGGAVGSSQTYLNIKDCDFINNTAKKGAAIMVGGIKHGLDGNLEGHYNTLDNCYFHNNTGTEEGGAVHITGHYNSAIDCIFDDNFAINGKGAAIYVEGNYASIDGSNFTNHQSDMGTVYIEGNYFNCSDSIFGGNVASHGGAGIYVEGKDTYIYNTKFTNNNASMHGGAVHTIGDNARILNSDFTYNNAIPSSTNTDYGLGGAVYIDGANNTISYSRFKHNTARNGSAIYNRGEDLTLIDDTFENNRAWSYFLFTESKPQEANWDENLETLVNVTLVGGDNLINAIYNDRSTFDISFHNVTYYMKPNDLYPTGKKTTTVNETHPVNGVGESHGGLYLYQDAREDNQVIKVNITHGGNKVYEYEGKTDMYGNVLLSIKKENLSDGQYHPGVYDVIASHPGDAIYTAIENRTSFRILPHVDLSVTKTSNKDVYFVGENAIFTIRVYGVGTNATNVRVKDILPKSLKFISASATRGSYDSINNEWYIGFLPHEGSETLTLTVKTTELGTFDNVVNVTCDEEDWNMSNNVDNKTIHVDLYYTKEANVTNTSAGEYFEYYIRIYNVGSTLYNETVRVDDVLPEGIRYAGEYKVEGADLIKFIGYPDEQVWEITNISAKTHAKITLKAQAVKDGIWNNTVRVSDYPPVNATVNVTSSADLHIIKSASATTVSKGDVFNWTIIVINHGPSKAFNVYVDDLLPNGLEIAGHATPSNNTRYDRTTGKWTIGTLGVEDYVTLIIPTRVTVSDVHNITNVAVVNSTTPDPDPTNNKDNDTVYLNPDVTIEKTVSTKNTYHGDTISWNITVTNNGPNDARNVYVIDQLPVGLRFENSTRPNDYNPVTGRWNIGMLKDGESITLIINTRVTIYDGYISNNATVNSSNDRDLDNNYDDDYTEVITEADVGVVKIVSNQTSHYGDEITWYIYVTNYGPNVAENVVLIDYLPISQLIQTRQPYVSKGQISHAGITGRWDIGDMAVNETQYMEVYTKVIVTGATIINTVTVNSTTQDPKLYNNKAENGTAVPPEADVAVVKKVNNFTPNKYDNVVWTITVVNNGPNVAEKVVVKDILPSGLKYVSHTAPDIGTFNHNTGVWSISTLNVGVRHSFNITTQVVDTGKITNEVNITTSTYDTDLTNNYDNETIDVPAIADLEINKLVSNKTSKYGDLINWTVTVHNKGPNNARNVVVNDKLPAGLVYITHKGPGLYDPTQGIWQIGDLGIDATVTLTITTRVNITNATITNVAVVTSTTPDNDTSNNEANNTTDVDPMADLAIYKVVSNTSPQKGDNITWTIVVVNIGPDTAINAVATDILPANLTYVSHKGNGTYNHNTGEWTIGDIEKGGNRTLYIVTTVNASKAVITNIVNVTSQTPDPDLTNNEDNATIDVDHQTDLEIIKTVSNATPKKGDEVVWNITVLNNGPDNAVNTRVHDILPSGLVWISDNSNGAYNPSTGIWTIGELPVNNKVTLLITTLVNVSGQNITNVAEVTTDTNDTNESNNKDNDTIEVPKDASADLEVIKFVSNKNPRFGDIITWTVTVTNNGPNTAVDAYVIDKLPKGLTYQSDDSNGKYDPDTGYWVIGNLTNGAKAVLNIKTLVNITNATITNVAVVNSTTPDNNTKNNKANNTTDVDPEVDLEIIKLVSNKTANKGDKITWTIVVTNKGPDTALEVYVKDKLPAGLVLTGYSKTKGIFDENDMTWYIKSLAKGESQTLTLTTLVNVTNKTLVNIVNVTNDVYDPNKTNNEANNTTDVDPRADLVVVKEVSKQIVKTGEVITWTVTVTNKGPDTAVNTRVTDILPTGLIFIKSDGNYNNNTGIWTVGDLANGASASLVITTQVNITNATIRNVANATSDTPGNSTPGNNTTDVGPRADLVVVKEVSKQTVKTGETIIWTVTVTNNGPDKSVNTRVIDKLPAGLIYNGHKAEDGNYDPDTGVWIIGDLANGESKQLVISTIANITNKTIVNVANVTSDTPGDRKNDTNNTTVVDDIADLEVVKLVSNATPKFGDEITWTIIVTNHGPDKAKAVNVTDKLPAGLRYTGHEGPGFYDSSNGIWLIGDMEIGNTVKLVIRTIVDISNGTIENIAVVNSTTPDNNTDNNIGNNTTKVNDDADLEIVKVVSNKNPKFGETITWTITVTNNGPSDAKNVRVTDKLPAGLIYNGANGNYDPVSGLWIVGDLANGKSASLVITTIVNITNTTIRNIANVTSETPDSNKTNNEANNTTDVGPKSDLIIVKEVSKKSVKTGEVITWTITVTNKGPDAAVNTRVTDKLPAGLIFITSDGSYDPVTGLWTVGDLANGASAKLVITTQVNITNATIVNVANVTSDTPGITPPPVNNSTEVDPKADLVIVKEVSKKSVKTGEVITWTITVTNKGPDAAVNTRVTDKLPAGLVYLTHTGRGNYDPVSGLWIVGDLANGASAKLVISTQVNITNTTIVNVANVTSDTPGITPPPVNNSTEVDPKADLVVVKEVSKQTVETGEVITWTITVTNNGPDAAVNTRVTDKLPAGLIFITSDGSYDPVTGLWIVGDLANGASAKLVITTQVNITNATIRNVANATSDTPGNNTPGNNTTKVDPKADLIVVKEVSKQIVKTGETVIWTITVTNNGPDTAVNTRVTDKLPDGLVYVTHKGEGNYDHVSGVWIVGDLANGESKQLAISTIANITNKTIVNVANVTSDTPGDKKNDTNNTTVVEDIADLEVVKIVIGENPHKGDVITWVITVINHGPSDAKNVIVTDRLPAGLIFKDADGNYNPDTGVWTIGDLANGEYVILRITTIVDITNAEITNVAVVESNTPDNNTDNNRDNDTTNVDPEADLKVIKTVSNPKPTVGDVITWTITVINLGPDAAEDVIVEDKLPAGLKLLSAKGSKGAYEDGIWTVGTLNDGEAATLVLTTKVTASSGTIRNVATATGSTYDPNKSNNRDDDVTKPKAKPMADLEITKVANVEKVKVGDKIIWTITVTNYGPDVAKNVRVKDVTVGDVEYISSLATRGSFDPLYDLWTIGDMDVGEEVVLVIVAKALSAGTVINTAEVVSDTPDPDMSNNKDKAIVIVKDKPTPDNPPKTPKTPTPSTPATMHATGNPIVMVLLALFALVGVTLRRKD